MQSKCWAVRESNHMQAPNGKMFLPVSHKSLWSSAWAQYQSVACFFVESDKLNFTGNSTALPPPQIAKPLEEEEEREEFAYSTFLLISKPTTKEPQSEKCES